MSEKISVLIADDHGIVRQGLRDYIALQGDMEVVGDASDGEQAVIRTRELTPDVVLMDLVMPGTNGIEATRQIRAISPMTRVIILTSFAEEEQVFEAIKAGASGYLMKDIKPEELAKAIRGVQAGEPMLHPEIARLMMREMRRDSTDQRLHDQLTEREMEVLRCIARGLSNKEIASELVISEKTVKTHVSNLLQKLHLADRTQAAIYAMQKKLVE
ncbi:MAG TPA: response regulator transcription factor [Dehalococcoidia bacterium]|nr:response regulator transcription factor [Dehalococcoidia bacterium]